MAEPIIPQAPTLAPVPVVPPPTAQTVYGAQNIAQAATNPVTPVNPALEEYNAFLNTPELSSARSEVGRIQQAINAEKQGLRNTTTGFEYQNDKALGTTGASMNLIGRQVGRATELSSNRQAALGEQLQAANSYLQGIENTRREQYNVYTQEKQRIQALIAQTGNKAGIKPTDTYEMAIEKAYKWEKKEQKKADKKTKEQKDDDEKKALKREIAKMGGKTTNTKGGSLKLKDLEKEYNRLSGEAYKKSQIKTGGGTSEKSKNAAITSLLTKAANLSDGGEAWAKKNAALYGLKESDLTPYLQGNWGDGYRSEPVKEKTTQPNLVELGNGKLLDKNTGDIFEVE